MVQSHEDIGQDDANVTASNKPVHCLLRLVEQPSLQQHEIAVFFFSSSTGFVHRLQLLTDVIELPNRLVYGNLIKNFSVNFLQAISEMDRLPPLPYSFEQNRCGGYRQRCQAV